MTLALSMMTLSPSAAVLADTTAETTARTTAEAAETKEETTTDATTGTTAETGKQTDEAAPAFPGGPQAGGWQFQNRGAGRNGMHRGPGRGFGGDSFEELLKDGVISQDTYDKISSYLKENAPAAPGKTTDGQAAAPNEANGTAGDDQTDASAEKDSSKQRKDPMSDLLEQLVKEEIIDQETSDSITEYRENHAPSAGNGMSNGQMNGNQMTPPQMNGTEQANPADGTNDGQMAPPQMNGAEQANPADGMNGSQMAPPSGNTAPAEGNV